MYGKIKNGKVEYAPHVFVRPCGEIIVNFDNDVDKMIEYGYKEIVEILPDYFDSDTEYLYIISHEVRGTLLYIEYGAKSKGGNK